MDIPPKDYDATLQVFATIEVRDGEPVALVVEAPDIEFLLRIDTYSTHIFDRDGEVEVTEHGPGAAAIEALGAAAYAHLHAIPFERLSALPLRRSTPE